MRRCFSTVSAILVVFVLAPALARPAEASPLGHPREGWWRGEMSAVAAYNSSKRKRAGDYWAYGSVAREWPAGFSERVTFDARVMPLLVYYQDTDNKEFYGIGVGLGARVYADATNQTGWFGEAGVSSMWHSRYLEGNSSRINFLVELGVGYKFRTNDWYCSVKYAHISNSSITSNNAGTNGVAIALGRRF